MMNNDRTVLLIAPEILNPRSMPCVGLAYIGAYLAEQGLPVRVVDSQFRKENAAEVIRRAEPTVVAITAESRTWPRVLDLAALAKRCGHTTVVGGLHASLIKEEVLDQEAIDYGIVGDGEIALYQLLLHLDGRRRAEDVSGLMYRTADGIQRNPNTTELNDLDLLPDPDYRLAGINNIDLYPLVTSRDCPYKCSYCTVGQISHGRFRQRSPERSVQELLAAKERYGIRGFVVVDENFAFRLDDAWRFCEELIDKDVNLPWTAFEGIRADSLTPDTLRLLRRSGCNWVFFGIETVENAVLRKVKKGSKLHHIQQAVDLAHEYGMNVGGFLILGLPDSTFERDMATIDWALKNLDKCTFWTAIPYRGTTMYHWVQKNATLLRQPVGDNLINTLSTQPFFETPEYPEHERKRAHVIASVRSGLTYFYEHLDREARTALSPEELGPDGRARRLRDLLTRYDPSYLPQAFPEDGHPQLDDPIQAALAVAANGRPEPLTNDLLGGMGTPATPVEIRTDA